ncbi:phosphohistidine phosphatase SixA [Pseudomonas protegens]|uniref:phosphohistidine phosphatase SixA n=1 Tax=Pseudomonas protegens TaxID=380021 RepID=UPI00301C1816
MKLWVLRHGQAESHAPTDAQRNLTAHGREEVLGSAARLIGQPIAAILASPYVRAQQTAQLVREALGFEGEIRTVPWLTPDANPLQVLEQLDSADNLLLVSHQPLVGNLIGLLQHGHLRDPQPMNTASLAELEGDWPLAGLMTLNAVTHP